MFETNSIIRASAGTGKTYALATRFIRLMLLDRVDPGKIVALTFSRAAAQEIYTKILDRLCRAATDGIDGKTGRTFAACEWDNLLEDYRKGRVRDAAAKLRAIEANPPPHGREDFARLLRRLSDTQHLGAIATLDSFILKIVRNFPKEMGVQNAVSVLDPIEENLAVDDAVRSALSKTDGSAGEVAEAFAAAQKGEYVRQCLGAIGGILARQGWRGFVLAHPECIAGRRDGSGRWTVESMAARLGVDLNSVCPELSMIPFNDMRRKNAVSPEEAFVSLARGYDGSRSFLETTDAVKDLINFFWDNPDATSYGYRYYREFTLTCGAAGAAAIRGAIRHMMNLYLGRQLETVVAKIRLVEAVEAEYERLTRRMGRLTFADFTAYSAEEEFSKRGIALKNVEFRFDSEFDHWALDEFQDTSELQWRCLRELVASAAGEGREDGGRTAMAVGDMKQSIYTWRGASARPFEDIAAWPAFAGFERDFSDSHRYGPHIADFVNRVFGLRNIRAGGVIPEACAGAVGAWREGWRNHVSHEAPDFVRVVAAAPDGADEEDDGILSALYAELAPIWKRHAEEKSVDTVGVLVRGNADGLKVADYLRRKGLDVVWEGFNPCGDDPVVQAVLSLLEISDHPSDSAAWRTASELIDVRSLLLPDCRESSSASAAVARLLATQGLARTLKDWCEALRMRGKIDPCGLTAEKLRQLVERAVVFEGRPSGDGGMRGFIEFVSDSGTREIAASSDVIRILTIHRSKGLGVDHVFVPLFESDRMKSAIDRPNARSPLYDGDDWVLSHLAHGTERFNERTKVAYERLRGERFAESLRTYYVALTRAKKSMFVILPEDDGEDPAKGLLMRDLIRNAVGGALPYEAGALPPFGKKGDAGDAGERHEPWPAGGARVGVERRTPSRGAGSAIRGTMANLFGANRGEAARRGVEAHAAYAGIGWIDPASPKSDLERTILAGGFREAFVKPSPEATVWRERSYELFLPRRSSGTWETGQFDRVVFTGSEGNRSATIYDFKTNAREAGESEDAFSDRMRRLHSLQMSSYRQALHRLTKIPPERIGTRLLLEATGRSLVV